MTQWLPLSLFLILRKHWIKSNNGTKEKLQDKGKKSMKAMWCVQVYNNENEWVWGLCRKEDDKEFCVVLSRLSSVCDFLCRVLSTWSAYYKVKKCVFVKVFIAIVSYLFSLCDTVMCCTWLELIGYDNEVKWLQLT